MICYSKNGFEIRQLSIEDGQDIYKMLKRIGPSENHFQNPVHHMSYNQYKEWLIEQDNWSKEIGLPKGYAGQTSFWMYVEGRPVAFGKIRHSLNENSRKVGGNIGYAVDPLERGKGYATLFLSELIHLANMMGIEEILLSVEKYNYASKRVIEKNGGYVFNENELRWFFHLGRFSPSAQ